MAPDDDQEYVQVVRTIRFKARLSQAELAKHLCVSARTVQRWESGVTAPPPGWMAHLRWLLSDHGQGVLKAATLASGATLSNRIV